MPNDLEKWYFKLKARTYLSYLSQKTKPGLPDGFCGRPREVMGEQIEIFFTIDPDDDCILWTRHDAMKPVNRKRSSFLSRDWLFLPAQGEGLEKGC